MPIRYKEDGRCDYLAPGNCEEGIETYQKEYIDPIVDVLSKYHKKVRQRGCPWDVFATE